jgi:hypothetical protein
MRATWSHNGSDEMWDAPRPLNQNGSVSFIHTKNLLVLKSSYTPASSSLLSQDNYHGACVK